MVIYGWLKVASGICCLGKTCSGIFYPGKTCMAVCFAWIHDLPNTTFPIGLLPCLVINPIFIPTTPSVLHTNNTYDSCKNIITACISTETIADSAIKISRLNQGFICCIYWILILCNGIEKNNVSSYIVQRLN